MKLSANMRFGVAVVLFACGTWMAPAQTAVPAPAPPPSDRPISLKECIDLAVKRNLDLQIARTTSDIAGYRLSSSYGVYDPTLSFSARHDYVSQPLDFDPNKSGIDFPYKMDTDILGAGLTGRLPFGLEYGLTGFAGGKDALTDFNANPNTATNFPGGIRDTNNYFANAGLTVRQHLLKDFWIDAERQTLLIRRKEMKISEQALRFQVMRIVLAVELAYYDLVAAREAIVVEEKSLELKRQLVAETRRRVEVGDLPPLDQEQAETQLQNALTALTAAKETFTDRQNTLKGLLTDNFLLLADSDLQPADPLAASSANVNRSRSFQNALRNRPDLAEARLAVERSSVSVQFQYNQLFPSLDFLGHYGGQGVDADSSSAISDTLNFRNPYYSYGAVVSIPLGNVTARNDYKTSKAARELAELQLKKAEQSVLLQIADYVNRVQSRSEQMGSTQKARTYAEAALSAEQKKLANGLSTSFFVLQLQETLTSARLAEVRALADYNKALANLAFAEGNNLERNGLTLEVK